MVKENADNAWALPGGWGDIGLSPSEVAIKRYKKLFIQCEIIGGKPKTGTETSAVDFFAKNQLPPLSEARNTESQIRLAFKHLHNPKQPVYLD